MTVIDRKEPKRGGRRRTKPIDKCDATDAYPVPMDMSAICPNLVGVNIEIDDKHFDDQTQDYTIHLTVIVSIDSAIIPVKHHWSCHLLGWGFGMRIISRDVVEKWVALEAKYYTLLTVLRGYPYLYTNIIGETNCVDLDEVSLPDQMVDTHRDMHIITDDGILNLGKVMDKYLTLREWDESGAASGPLYAHYSEYPSSNVEIRF